MIDKQQTRRSFIGKLALATAGLSFPGLENFAAPTAKLSVDKISGNDILICAFTKMFDQFGKDMFSYIADAGYKAVELTVRPNGYVLPENVAKNLPRAVNDAAKKGLSIPLIATEIVDASDPETLNIVKTASETGIKQYRMGRYYYDQNLNTEQNLEKFRKNLKRLEELNAKYGMTGCHQNHTGGMFGGAVWDLWLALKDLDPRYMSCQYDIYHAVIEGLTSWPSGFDAIGPYIGSLGIKDFIYELRNDKWNTTSVPIGRGAVDFKRYFGMLKSKHITGAMSVHYEFLYNEAFTKTDTPKEKMKNMFPALSKEIVTLKEMMKSAGISCM